MSASAGLARTLAELTAPLRDALEDAGALELLLADLGWSVTLSDEQASAVAALMPIADALETLGAASGEDPSAQVIEDAIAAAATVWEAVRDLSHVSAADLAALPAPLDAPATWATLALDLPEYLVLRWLQLAGGLVYGLARLAGIATDGGGGEPSARWSWEALGDFLNDPGARLAALYGWGGALDHVRLLDTISGLADRPQASPRAAPRRVPSSPPTPTSTRTPGPWSWSSTAASPPTGRHSSAPASW